MFNRIYLLIIALVIILFLIIVVLGLKQPNTSSAPSLTLTPSISLNRQLQITKINPPANTDKQYFPVTQITFTFNQEMGPSAFFYEVFPPTETVVLYGKSKNEIILSPEKAWTEGVTTITIKTPTTSLQGNLLGRDTEYILNTAYPQTIDPDIEL
ncbi:MAG: hypothetical protein Q7S61_06090 [bacterium]|nr:hypothetical protein [bacterium]